MKVLVVPRKPHPLDGASKRVMRADRHIQEVRNLVIAFGKACEDHVIVDDDSKPGQRAVGLKTLPPIPPDLPLALSDAVHNLRAALDYIVYELASYDSKKTQDGTQFPIADFRKRIDAKGNPSGFVALVPRYLKGVSAAHVRVINRLQPYKHKRVNKWLKTLREISNPDKHRTLHKTRSKGGRYVVRIHPPRRTQQHRRTLPTGEQIHVDASYAISIRLPHGTLPVLPTLEELYLGVRKTIDAFKPEFKV